MYLSVKLPWRGSESGTPPKPTAKAAGTGDPQNRQKQAAT